MASAASSDAPAATGPHLLKPLSFGPGAAATATGMDLTYHGGAIDKTPKVFIIYWGWNGVDPKGEAPQMEAFFSGIGGDSWARIDTQYYESARGRVTNPTGQLAGVWHDDSSVPPNGVSEAALEVEAAKGVAHFGFDVDADYYVATPSGHNAAGFGSSYCAYHWTYQDANGNTFAWTNMPYIPDAGANCGANFVNGGHAGDLDGVTIVAGHEYAEVVTDPFPFSGWVGPGSEIGDECAWISSGTGGARNITLSTGSFAVQSLYSNNDHGCVTAAPLPPHVTVGTITATEGAVGSHSASVRVALHNNGQGAAPTTVDVWAYATGSPSAERRHVGSATTTVPAGGNGAATITWSTLGELGRAHLVVTSSTLWQDDDSGTTGAADVVLGPADPGLGLDALNNHASAGGVAAGTSWAKNDDFGLYLVLPVWGTTVIGDYDP